MADKTIGGEDYSKMGNAKLDGALQDGQTVPIRVGDSEGNGHSMSISDVRPDKDGNPQYFVHDPMTGKSVWVPKVKLDSGQFTVEFGISNGEYCKIQDAYVGEDIKPLSRGASSE